MKSAFTSSPHTTYQVAAIQYAPVPGEKEQNSASMLHLVEEAASNGARIIVLPELATTGSCWQTREEVAPYVESVPGMTTGRFQEVAERYGCYIALSLPEVDPATQVYYNAAVLIGPDGLVGTYRKLHTAITEPRWARDGDHGIPVWETPLGRIGLLLGTDAMYFEAPRCAALKGADVLLLPASWSDETCPRHWWVARAFENGMALVVANRCDRERTIQFSGGSCILNPDGSLQKSADSGVGITYGTIDLDACREKRWRQGSYVLGAPLADRRPAEYVSLTHNTYLWEPLRYHSLYGLGELPPGQLSCVGFVQIHLQDFAGLAPADAIVALRKLLRDEMTTNAPACPDVLVLPELFLPGSIQTSTDGLTAQEQRNQHFRQGAITVPGPETEALVSLAKQLQVSLVLGIAERAGEQYYNTVLLLDPEGIYGVYRKLHLDIHDRGWASPGDLGLPVFDTPTGRIGLATGYDVLFPETLRVLAGKGADLVCAPTFLAWPGVLGRVPERQGGEEEERDPYTCLIWRVRAAEHNVYLALANWDGSVGGMYANGLSGIYPPTGTAFAGSEVVADVEEWGLMMMTIDTREQRTGRRTSRMLEYSPGDLMGSLTGELAYDVFDSIPGNVVRSKPWLRKRLPFWYLDLVRSMDPR